MITLNLRVVESASIGRLKPAEVGDNVIVPIPLVDQGRAEFPNLRAVIISKEEGDLYKLGTHHGILSQHYTRNQFSPSGEQLMKTADVPRDKQVRFREVVNAEAMVKALKSVYAEVAVILLASVFS